MNAAAIARWLASSRSQRPNREDRWNQKLLATTVEMMAESPIIDGPPMTVLCCLEIWESIQEIRAGGQSTPNRRSNAAFTGAIREFAGTRRDAFTEVD